MDDKKTNVFRRFARACDRHWVVIVLFAVAFYVAFTVYANAIHPTMALNYYTKNTYTVEKKLFISFIIVITLTVVFSLALVKIWVELVDPSETGVLYRDVAMLSSFGLTCGFVIMLCALKDNKYYASKCDSDFAVTAKPQIGEYLPSLMFFYTVCATAACMGFVFFWFTNNK